MLPQTTRPPDQPGSFFGWKFSKPERAVNLLSRFFLVPTDKREFFIPKRNFCCQDSEFIQKHEFRNKNQKSRLSFPAQGQTFFVNYFPTKLNGTKQNHDDGESPLFHLEREVTTPGSSSEPVLLQQLQLKTKLRPTLKTSERTRTKNRRGKILVSWFPIFERSRL